MKSTKALSILGTRPQIIEFAPLIHIAKKRFWHKNTKRQEKSNSLQDERASERMLNIFKEFDSCPLKR